MKVYKTKSLDRAAYLVYLGGEFVSALGSMDNTVFTLNVPKEVFRAESNKTLVNHKEYMKCRQVIKENARIARGLPARYHKSKLFTFMEVAHAK